MAAHVPKVEWRCAVCPVVEQRMPSDAKVKCCYRCRGEYARRFGNRWTPSAMENRIRRVMFARGLTRERALDFVAGWRQGFEAGRSVLHRGLKVGSRKWERVA